MTNNLGHKLVIGQGYTSRIGNPTDVFFINGMFGRFADAEHKRTRKAVWIDVDYLIPVKISNRYIED